jgi:predicted nucleic acid-binding Zn ribbon protein
MPESRPSSRKVESAPSAQRRRALAEWRGVAVPPDLRRFEKRIGDLVPRVMQKSGAAERMGHSQIADAWESMVGAFIAKHSRPVALRRGVLTVAVTQAAVRYDVERRHKAGILERLQERFGPAVKSLRFQNG